MDDVSATPEHGEGHPTDLSGSPLPPPPPGSSSTTTLNPRLRNPLAILPFHDRLAPQLNAILPLALPIGAHVRNLTRFDYNFLYVWLWCVNETLVSNHVWPLLLLICFFEIRFFRTSSTSPSRKNEPVPYDRLQTLGNQSGTFRQKNIDLLKFWKVSFSSLFQLPSLPPPIALFRCRPRSNLPSFSTDNKILGELSIICFWNLLYLIYLNFYNIIIHALGSSVYFLILSKFQMYDYCPKLCVTWWIRIRIYLLLVSRLCRYVKVKI